jgi:Zn-dependent peptidase ImmA (M78 family)
MTEKEKASSILEKYPYTGSYWIYELLDRFNICYFLKDLDNVDALMVRLEDKEAIIIDKDSSPTKKCELIAHELGHFLFHTGNGILYKKKNPLWVSQDEVKAQRFALYLLIPDERLIEMISAIDPPGIEGLAEEFGVTIEFMEERLRLFEGDLLVSF